MKIYFAIASILLLSSTFFGQIKPDLRRVVATETAFAQLAAEKGTRAAFLANITDDAVIFNPEKVNAKELWTSRGDSKSLLSWAPNFADVSADGVIGYTTGNWEFRRTKSEEPIAFGEFITLWSRQSDSKYKFVIDIGIGHSKPEKYSTEWTTSKARVDTNRRRVNATYSIKLFIEMASNKGLSDAFRSFAADDIRSYREDHTPSLGKVTAILQADTEKEKMIYENAGTVYSTSNLAYFLKEYTFTRADKSVEKGNAFQIWKFTGGKWKIVLDILKPVPTK